MRATLRTACFALAALAGSSHAAAPEELVKRAIATACTDPAPELGGMAKAIGGVETSSEEPIAPGGAVIGWRRIFERNGSELAVQRIAPGGRLRRVSVQLSIIRNGVKLPALLAVAAGDCEIRSARRLTYDATGAAETIVGLDADFQPLGEPELLNPAVPAGDDVGGVPVALFDSGVNYLLPEIAARLARDERGAILGYDFWDMDDRPFDANPARSAFFPQRHGTQTASVLLDEAPVARLVPYRYPRPDMHRMATLLEDAAGKGVVVFNLSLGSDKPDEWEVFAEAARAHPDMLFVVSAGNNDRDIDREPVYPAALVLDNMITVTSSVAHREPAGGANW
ncbi:MAG: S8 family serine peptidase, partial [Gammaproteobacteria bacterium]